MRFSPEKGEMVLLRDVSPRAAYRPAPPGIALIVDPKPNREIHGSLGTGELSDDDIAMMSSGRLDASGRPASLPEQMVGRALQGTVGGSAGNGGIVSGAGIASGIGGVTGAIGGATRSIAPTITGFLYGARTRSSLCGGFCQSIFPLWNAARTGNCARVMISYPAPLRDVGAGQSKRGWN